MTEVYNESDFIYAKKMRKLILAIYFIVLALFIGGAVGVLVFYIMQPYATPLRTPLIIAETGITLFALIFSFVYLGIVNKRTKAYYKVMKAIQVSRRERSKCVFKNVGTPEEKDSVDFNVLVFLHWYDKRKSYFERNVLVDKEKPLPQFKQNEVVEFVTQGNVLISYEVVGYDEEPLKIFEEMKEHEKNRY